MTAAHRPGESDEVDPIVGHGPLGVVVARVHELVDVLGQPRLSQGLPETLGHQRGLRGVLEHHRVARDEGGHHRVDGDHPRVVPGGHHEDHAEGLTLDEELEGLLPLDGDVGQRLRSEPAHGPGAVGGGLDLARREANGPPHLLAELGRPVVGARLEHLDELAAHGQALVERALPPGLLRLHRPIERGAQRVPVAQLALHEHRAVDGGDGLHRGHAGLLVPPPWAVLAARVQHRRPVSAASLPPRGQMISK